MDSRETIYTFSQIIGRIFQFLIIVVPVTVLLFISYGRYRETRGPKVIAIGRHHRNSFMGLAVFILLFFLARLFLPLQDGTLSTTIFDLIFVGVLTAFGFITFFSKVYIMEDGIIRYYLERTYWGDIGAYYWDKNDPNRLHIFKKNRRNFQLILPPEKREAVNQILETHLKTV